MFNVMWILILLLGIFLLIAGALPIGRFPSFTSDIAILKPRYGRILGGAIILWAILSRIFISHSIPAILLMSFGLLLIAVVCIFLSLNEPVS